MQDLHTNLTAIGVHGIGYLLVISYRFVTVEAFGLGVGCPFVIRPNTAGYDKCDSSGCASAVKCRHVGMTARHFFKAGVHGAHQDPVFKLSKA